MAKFQSTKTYGTDRGLSCCFRQWKANHSHCSTLHGYSLGFKFIWESETLDEKNWVFDFGGMKPIKEWLDSMFDHTILVAEDDPALEMFKGLAAFSTNPEWNGKPDHVGYLEPTPYSLGRVCALRIVPGVGCEMTAKMVYDKASEMLEEMKAGKLGRYNVNPDVRLVSVECFEHGANSALFHGDEPFTTSKGVDIEDKATITSYFTASNTQLTDMAKEIEDLKAIVNSLSASLTPKMEYITADFHDNANKAWIHTETSTRTTSHQEPNFMGDVKSIVADEPKAADEPTEKVTDSLEEFLRSFAQSEATNKPVSKDNTEILEKIADALKVRKIIRSKDIVENIINALNPKPTPAEFDISAFGWELAELFKIPTLYPKPKK